MYACSFPLRGPSSTTFVTSAKLYCAAPNSTLLVVVLLVAPDLISVTNTVDNLNPTVGAGDLRTLLLPHAIITPRPI